MRYLLSDLVREFNYYNIAQEFAEKTTHRREAHMKKLIQFSKHEYLDEITTTDIRRFIINERENGSTAVYCNSILRSIRSFYVFCENDDYISGKEFVAEFNKRKAAVSDKWDKMSRHATGDIMTRKELEAEIGL